MAFKNLRRYEVPKSDTQPFPFYAIDGEPTMLCKPATESNKAYHNALLKRNAKVAQRFRAGRKVNREMLERNRDDDRELYCKFVIAGWENVVNDEGEAVPFSPDACAEFIGELPNWLFDELRVFCALPSNFIADDEIDENDVGEQAGN